MSGKLEATERDQVILPELKKLKESETKEGSPLEQVERVHEKLRQKYGDKDFCFSAQRNKRGEYEYFIDGEPIK